MAQSNDYPFAGPAMRYQQWYSGAEWMNHLGEPMRVLEVAFKAGATGGQVAGKTVELEISIAHGPPVAPVGFFDGNLVRDRAVVFPRQEVLLGAGTPGTFPLVCPFTQPFIWDGESSVVLDILIFPNRLPQNQPFNFVFDATATSPGKVWRLFTVNNPNATDADFLQNGWGLVSRFTVRPGINLPLPGGTGCPGSGGFIPQATSTLASPGATWTHTLTGAASQRPAFWVLGFDTTMSQTLNEALPLELLFIGATGCFLRVDPVFPLSSVTVGGGPGAGSTSVAVQLPPVTPIIGLHAYSQWLVSDPGAPNGVGSVTGGLWHIVAPHGG